MQFIIIIVVVITTTTTTTTTIFPRELLCGEHWMSWSVVIMEEPVIEVSRLNRM
jgi:hypothetical protein